MIRFLRSAADPLFESASKVFGAGLTAVVLTGGNSNATDGVRSVKRHGGDVIAQDLDKSDLDQMPQSAIETVCVDHVLPCTRPPTGNVAGSAPIRARIVRRTELRDRQ